MPENRGKNMVFGAVLLVCALGLGVEFLLQAVFATSICETEACRITGDYLAPAWLNEQRLILAGAVFFMVLFGLFCVARWGHKRAKAPVAYAVTALWVLLFAALAFDGAMVGFQLTAAGSPCWVCAATAAGLIAVFAAACWYWNFLSVIVLGMAVWCASFSAGWALEGPGSGTDIPRLEEAAVTKRVYSQDSGPQGEGAKHYLFFSYDCDHCTAVLHNLSQGDPEGTWHLLSTDSDNPEALASLARALGDKSEGKDLFSDVLRGKNSISEEGKEKRKGYHHCPEKIKKAAQDALAYLRGANLPGVPTLIVERSNGIRVSLPGARNIAGYLYEEGMIEHWHQNQH